MARIQGELRDSFPCRLLTLPVLNNEPTIPLVNYLPSCALFLRRFGAFLGPFSAASLCDWKIQSLPARKCPSIPSWTLIDVPATAASLFTLDSSRRTAMGCHEMTLTVVSVGEELVRRQPPRGRPIFGGATPTLSFALFPTEPAPIESE